jgi:hypothetical protein
MINFRGGPLDRRRFVLTAAGTVGSLASLAWPRMTGSTAVAYHVGSARANDGRTYNLETDIRPDPGAFLGEIAPAVSTGWFSGEELGFEFESNRGASTSPRGYAQIGTERNGVFL